MISTYKIGERQREHNNRNESKGQQVKKGGGAKREQKKIKLERMESEGKLEEERKGVVGVGRAGVRLCGWCNLSVSEG